MGDHRGFFDHPDPPLGVNLSVPDQGDKTGDHPYPVGVNPAQVGLDQGRSRRSGIFPRDTHSLEGLFGEGAQSTGINLRFHLSPLSFRCWLDKMEFFIRLMLFVPYHFLFIMTPNVAIIQGLALPILHSESEGMA
jgi:hypothetical protein